VPYWSVYCVWCGGYIADALLECVPARRQAEAGYRQLVQFRPGAALACPYCNGLIGFDDKGQVRAAEPGWPVFRYGLAELELKRDQDGEPPTTPLADWALRYRFTRPGSHQPLGNYRYAEQAPPDETVP
jgi:hypothetical protein